MLTWKKHWVAITKERENNMKNLVVRVTKLIDVKSIMTLTLTYAFVILVNRGVVGGDQFMTIFTMIVGFYFGTQATKKDKEQPEE